MSKFEHLVYETFAYVFVALLLLTALTVPTAIVVWAIKWILVTLGVIA